MLAADCAYVGDSIAVALQALDPACAVHAHVGASAGTIVRHYRGLEGQQVTIISAGSNLPADPDNLRNILALRTAIRSKVIWIVPYHPEAAAVVSVVASHFGDLTVRLAGFPTRDKVHPSPKSTAAIVRLLDFAKGELARLAR